MGAYAQVFHVPNGLWAWVYGVPYRRPSPAHRWTVEGAPCAKSCGVLLHLYHCFDSPSLPPPDPERIAPQILAPPTLHVVASIAVMAHGGHLSAFGHAMHALHSSCRSAVEQIGRHIAQPGFSSSTSALLRKHCLFFLLR